MYIACVYSAVGCQNGRNQRAHRTLHHPFKSSSVNLRWLQSKSSKVWQNGNFGNILCWSGSKMCHNVPDAARFWSCQHFLVGQIAPVRMMLQNGNSQPKSRTDLRQRLMEAGQTLCSSKCSINVN